MFVTVRQLEDLYRQGGSNGHVTLPYRARLTPLASDWVRAKKVVLGYSDGEAASVAPANAAPSAKGEAASAGLPASAGQASGTGTLLWWCDGHSGPAKAALVALEKESRLAPLNVPSEGKRVATVVKTLAS